MPTNSERTLSPTDRRRQIASILAKGVIRWLKHEKTAGIMNAQKTSPGRKNRLELSDETSLSTQACPQCSAEGHDADANHCKYCGGRL